MPRDRPRLAVWPPLPPSAHFRRPRRELPFPLADGDCVLFARARHGIWHGVRALGLADGDVALVPAYHHGSEIEALARAGLELRFYEADERLEPDPDELDGLLDERVRLLHIVHYLGFPQDSARWRAWCDERGLLLSEDAAQAWLASGTDGRPVGELGDLAVFCLYKTYGLPDGAALLARAPVPAGGAPIGGAGAVARRHARWAAGRMGLAAAAVERFAPARVYSAAEDFALGEPGSAPSAWTVRLLPRVVADEAALERRARYALLLEALAPHVAPPFDELPPGASPFAFPIDVDDKARVRTRLAADGVDALDLWSEPHPLAAGDRFPRAAARRARTLALPVHHELRTADVERIAGAALGALGRRRPELRLEPLARFDALGEEWDALAERAGNVFGTRDFLELWWEHFGRGRRPLLVACRDRADRLVAVVPAYLWRGGGVRVARLMGHGAGDELGPVCAAADRPAAARAVRRLLAEWECPALLAEQVPGGWAALAGARVVSREGSPILRFAHATWEDYVAAQSRNLRDQLRRRERKLARENALAFRFAATGDELDAGLDALFRLHRLRWSESETNFGRREAFHRAFARRALERGWARLWLLEAGGDVVAAWYGFRFAGAESYYQMGRDPGWDRASVGFVLLAHTMREALADGLREYRFLRGGEDYKYRFATHDPGLETAVLGRGPAGVAGTAAVRTLRAARRMTRNS